MQQREVQLEDSWKAVLKDQFAQPYMQQISNFLREQVALGKEVYPPGSLMFNAFTLTPLPQVKVVILGQDPYHGEGQAHGLSFSVPRGIATPPSLLNIYKELQRDFGFAIAQHGDLTEWAQQGVLLLNTSLSVERASAGSHAKIGWQNFTDKVIETISQQQSHVVFMLWGAHAKSKINLIDRTKHLVLTAVHPSPLSAYRGFIGCEHFSRCNEFLQQTGQTPIDWQLSP